MEIRESGGASFIENIQNERRGGGNKIKKGSLKAKDTSDASQARPKERGKGI